MPTSAAWPVFEACASAIAQGSRTDRPRDDKEFHFQRWVQSRISVAGYSAADPGRNSYPDFPIEGMSEGYEVKGITAGSRENDFDCNSALPSGLHDGRHILYVFGRYERPSVGGDRPRVLDLALVHGSLLNAGGGYRADNRSMRVLGSYGDVLLRDRKMYVAYTPYRLLTNVRDRCTLVLPLEWPDLPQGAKRVGSFSRSEHERVLIGYLADLKANTLKGQFEENPNAGRVHEFEAWALPSDSRTSDSVVLA